MSIFKCKMCGGDLEIQPGQTVAQCEYCGTKQTLPRLDGDRKANLYDRANHFRRNNDYDKAMGIYEQILTEDNTDAEAYWSLVLCRYGIEYVEDPATHKRMPTVNRAQYTSIFDDDNYKSALEHADAAQREVYEAEAKAINEIQKGILAISQKEAPFDVFICYKETDQNGRRTQDSVLANDLYHQLTQEGFKVFFSRITLEDKLGTAYEPYIFAALNSAKVMVVLGTRPEYFNAVWVKNEWSRYLALIRSGAKKVLIPAYRDMDPYDLPEEFSHLQAQDMSKLGFMQDLIRGIKKLTEDAAPKQSNAKETVVVQQNAVTGNVQALLDRGNMALEDGEWEKADGFFEDVLNQNARCAEAYLGKALVEAQAKDIDSFFAAYQYKTDTSNEKSAKDSTVAAHVDEVAQKYKIPCYLEEAKIRALYGFDFHYRATASAQEEAWRKVHEVLQQNRNVSRAIEFAQGDIKEKLDQCIRELDQKQEQLLQEAKASDQAAYEKKRSDYCIAAQKADETVVRLYQDACAQREKDYQDLREKAQTGKTIADFQAGRDMLSEGLKNYKDSNQLAELCKEKERALRMRQDLNEKKRAKRKKNILIVSTVVLISAAIIAIIYAIILTTVIIPNNQYNAAVALIDDGKVTEAYERLIALNGYKDSAEKAESIYDLYKQEKLQEKLRATEVGDTVLFGSYEQDNVINNGKEAIEWLVLAKERDKMLVISRYALDCQQYNTSNADVTWETCSLRAWLNNTFLNNAFYAEEQAKIQDTNVSDEKNPQYGTEPDNVVNDKVFLLSVDEVERYFSSDSERACRPTEYAVANGSYNRENGNCHWWLRVPRCDSNNGACVCEDGYVASYGIGVTYDIIGVRPAMWISLEG
mgnify:CR=1 FL=1